MSRRGRAAEQRPAVQGGRIARGKVGVTGSTRHVDLAITPARGKGLAKHGVPPPSKRGGE